MFNTLYNGTVSQEDWGEDNKDPDWLIEQSIVGQVALCNDEKVDCHNHDLQNACDFPLSKLRELFIMSLRRGNGE